MPRWQPLHPDFVLAVRVLDAVGMPYAELWRRLRPVAARLDVPQPTYWRVRRLAIEVRRCKDAWTEQLERVLGDVVVGRVPLRRG